MQELVVVGGGLKGPWSKFGCSSIEEGGERTVAMVTFLTSPGFWT